MSQNPDTPRSPASTIKVVTTFAALDLLGPAYTWHTRASIRGVLDDGVLDGDLILQGGGDPYMTLERWWSFAQALRARGLKTIHGDIVIDNTAFSAAAGGSRRIRRPAESRVQRRAGCADGEFPVHRIPRGAGCRRAAGRCHRHIRRPANLTIENHVRFAAGRCGGAAGRVDFKVASESWDRVIFSGALSPHCAERSFTRVLLQPATYAFGTFVELWHEFGGEFSGKLRARAGARRRRSRCSASTR